MISCRIFSKIFENAYARQKFLEALKDEGIEQTVIKSLQEIEKALKESYPRNSTSVFQGLVAQMFNFDFNEQNFEIIYSMFQDLNRGNIAAALEKEY